MKYLLSLLACICLTVTFSNAQVAQKPAATQAKPIEDRVDRTMESLTGRLSLSQEQQDKIKPFLKMADARRIDVGNAVLLGDTKDKKFMENMTLRMNEIRDTQVKYIKSLLTEKQISLFDSLKLAQLFQ
jgi:hypothetical protein